MFVTVMDEVGRTQEFADNSRSAAPSNEMINDVNRYLTKKLRAKGPVLQRTAFDEYNKALSSGQDFETLGIRVAFNPRKIG